MRVERLDVERARTATDQHRTARRNTGEVRCQAAVGGRSRRSRLGEQQAAGGRCRRSTRGTRERDPEVVRGHRENGLLRVAVVVRRGADHLVADAGSTGRVEAVRAAVADRRDDDHPGVHERTRAAGGRGLRPVVERVTDRHVEHVHAVRLCALHRREHDVVRRRAAATEHAVGTELDARGDALHTARGCGAGPDDPRDVRAVAVAVVRIGIRNRSRAVERVRRTGGRELAGVVRIPDEVPARDHAAAREVVVEDAVVAGGDRCRRRHRRGPDGCSRCRCP